MQKHIIKGLSACLLLLLAACDQGQVTPELPTLFPTAVVAPSEQPTDLPTTVPATFTPAQRPDLPPTWTDTPEPTPTPEEASPIPVTVAPVPSLSPACDTFVPDVNRNRRDFMLGTAPEVFWTPVEGALTYQITLIDRFGVELIVDYTSETSYTFAAELFEKGQRYGWEVYPRDERGIQMCYGRGDELVPFVQP